MLLASRSSSRTILNCIGGVRLNSSSSTNFLDQRKVYEKRMSDLRIQWANDFKRRQLEKKEREEAERKRIVLDKAVKLREKRAQMVISKEQHEKRRAIMREKYMAKLARNWLFAEKRDEKIKERYRRAFADIREESVCWINEHNIDSKITPELFDKPGTTTGVVSPHRYQVVSDELERYLADMDNDGDDDGYSASSIENRLHMLSSAKFTKRLFVEDFLSQLVGTGQEREEYNQLVQQFSEIIDTTGGFNEVDKAYDDLLSGRSDNRPRESSEDSDLYDYEESDAGSEDLED